MFLYELFTVMLAGVALIPGLAFGYILIRQQHRKWKREDDEHQAKLRHDMMAELNREFQVDGSGRAESKTTFR